MIIKGDKLIFSTGKIVYANKGIVGLTEPDDEFGWRAWEGYDGGISLDKLTKKEIIELANYMIDLWEIVRSVEKGMEERP